jgi:NAD(P)-dependent dehydrogenase (short-subunit alcohol dehydrogenase family)
MEISGTPAIVTGAGSGLGAETARMLAKAGAKVAVLDIDGGRARALADDIGGLGLPCDVANPEEAQSAVAQASKAHGPARILVNCAGIAPAKRIVGRDGPMALADFEAVVRVNLIGTFNLMRLAAAEMSALPPLADDERGVIISTASIAAFEGQIGQAAYAASKAGVVGLTLPVARELARVGSGCWRLPRGSSLRRFCSTCPRRCSKAWPGRFRFPTASVSRRSLPLWSCT